MAQVQGRREVVQDPLRQAAQRGAELQPQAVGLVRAPDRPNMSGFGRETEQLNAAMSGLSEIASDLFEREMDTAITDGKVAYMSGVTEQELMKTGNRYTQMGYKQLETRNDVNNWYLQEQSDLLEKSNRMAPEDYQKYLSEKRKTYLDGIEDPYARKVAVAAFEQLNPDLASKQFTQNNAFNYEERKNGAREFLRTGVLASPTSGKVIPGETTLTIQPQAVEPVMNVSAMDRDLGIRTLIGEAGNQGEYGMAAVAHNFRNRVVDSRYPKSIAGVVRQPGQYSVWNNGKEGRTNSLMSIGTESATYQKAAKVFDAVMSGRHIDPTGGALFYHSPAGMKAYAASGVQVSNSTLARTRGAESDANSIRIGGHVFYGKSNGLSAGVRDMIEPVEQGDTGEGATGYVDPMVSAPNSVGQFPGKAADDLLPVTKGTVAGQATDLLNEAPAQEGVAGIKEAGAPNEVMDFLTNYKGLKPGDMADILSEEISSAFLSGSDSLFENSGGIATLRKLGASAAHIDKVVRARDKFLDDQDKKFDEDSVLFTDDIMREADTPGVDRKALLKKIDGQVDRNKMSDTAGRTLAASALSKIRENEKSNAKSQETEDEKNARYERWSNKEFQQEIGSIFQRILTDDIQLPQAQEMSDDLAARYGMDKQDVAKIMGEMFDKDQTRQNTLRSQAETRAKATATSDENKRLAMEAIGRGQGASNLDGNVKIVNQDGTTSSMTTKEYVTKTIKDQGMALHGDDPNKVAAYVFPKLQAQGLVDQETKAQIVGALTGPIVVKDDSGKPKLTEQATSAYNTYANMRRNNTLNGSFIADQVGDEYSRSLLEQAYSLDAGNLTGTEALIRAKEMIDNKEIDPAYKNRTDTALDKALDGQGEAFVRERMAGSWSDWLNTTGDTVANSVSVDSNTMQQALRNRALRYRDLNPWQTPEAAIELAKQDLQRDTKRVAGNLVISPTQLHTAAGLESPEAMDKAMSHYLAANAGELFGTEALDAWTPMAPLPGISAGVPYGASNPPPVKLLWVEGMGQFIAWRVTDPETGAVDLGHRALIDPAKVGTAYKSYRAEEGPGAKFAKMFNRNIVQANKEPREELPPEGNGMGLKDGFGLFPALRNSVTEFRDNFQETERSLGQETQGQPAR